MTNFMPNAADVKPQADETTTLRRRDAWTALPSSRHGLAVSESRRCGVLGRRSHDHDSHGNIGGHGDE